MKGDCELIAPNILQNKSHMRNRELKTAHLPIPLGMLFQVFAPGHCAKSQIMAHQQTAVGRATPLPVYLRDLALLLLLMHK